MPDELCVRAYPVLARHCPLRNLDTSKAPNEKKKIIAAEIVGIVSFTVGCSYSGEESTWIPGGTAGVLIDHDFQLNQPKFDDIDYLQLQPSITDVSI